MSIRDLTERRPEDKAKLTKEGEDLEAFARSLGAEIYGVAKAKAFKEFPQKAQPSKFAKTNGKDEAELEFKISDIKLLSTVREERVKSISLKVSVDDLTSTFIQEIDQLSDENKGETPVKFLVYDPIEKIWVHMYSRNRKVEVSNRFINYLEKKMDIQVVLIL